MCHFKSSFSRQSCASLPVPRLTTPPLPWEVLNRVLVHTHVLLPIEWVCHGRQHLWTPPGLMIWNAGAGPPTVIWKMRPVFFPSPFIFCWKLYVKHYVFHRTLLCVCVCVCVCVCRVMHVLFSVHVNKYVCMDAWSIYWAFFLNAFLPLWFETGSLTKSKAHQFD